MEVILNTEIKIENLRPGDVVWINQELATVLAKLNDRQLLCTDGKVINFSAINGIYSAGLDIKEMEVGGGECYRQLSLAGNVWPKIVELSVGDVVLILTGNTASVSTVAVVDRPRGFVFGRDGELLPWGRENMPLTGWRTEEKDLLTEEGRKVMHQMYE